MLRYLVIAVIVSTFAAPAQAAIPQALANAYFYASSKSARATAYQALADADQTVAATRFAYGTATMQTTIERFLADLQRYGFTTQAPDVMAMVLGLPISPNETTTQPEQIDYAKFRDSLIRLDDGMAKAIAILAEIPNDAALTLAVDLAEIPVFLLNEELIPGQRFASMLPDETAEQIFAFNFDRADAYWFQGYANVIRAHTQFLLAHDFERAFNLSFSAFFPHSMPKTPLNMDVENAPDPFGFAPRLNDSREIADIISLIHLMNFPVSAPERRAAAADHLKEMIRLSRLNWQAIQTETDNDNEWLPGPHQPGNHPIAGVSVSEKQVAGWHTALTLFEAVLDGKMLVPHWRFPGMGINMASFFNSTENFDPILILTGPGVLPFLETGKPMMELETFEEFDNDFGPLGFIGTAIWFN